MGRTADSLVEAVEMDCYPSMGALCDFGLDGLYCDRDRAYRAYHSAIRSGELTADQLHEAVRSNNPGKALTDLLRNCDACGDNGVTIKTASDDLFGDDDSDDDSDCPCDVCHDENNFPSEQ